MKKLMILALGLGLLGCSEIDNYKAPDAHITGRLIDAETKEPIISQGRPGANVRAFQFYNGVWANNHSHSFYVMHDGSYQSYNVFSGRYELGVVGPFMPVERKEVTLPADGVDFEVLPLLRIKLDEITLNETTRSIHCKFTITVPDGATGALIQYAMLYGNSEHLYYNSGDGGGNSGALWTDHRYTASAGAKNFSMMADAGKTTLFEGVDLTKPVYFRIAALSNAPGNTYWNYSPVLRLK